MGSINRQIRYVFQRYREHKSHMLLILDIASLNLPQRWRVQRNAIFNSIAKQSIETRCQHCHKYTKVHFWYDKKKYQYKFICKPCMVLEEL